MADYLNNNDFLNLLKDYKKTKKRKLYNKIGKNFTLIAINALNHPRYINYTQDIKDELVSDAVFNMCRYWEGFNLEIYDNPHAYFTKFAYSAFLLYFKKYYKRRDRCISLSFIDNFDNKDVY